MRNVCSRPFRLCLYAAQSGIRRDWGWSEPAVRDESLPETGVVMANSKELRKRLAQLDRKWEEEQQAYMLAGRLDGAPQPATRTKAIVGGVLVGKVGFARIPGH